MKYLMTVKVEEPDTRFVYKSKEFSLSERRLYKVIHMTHELFNESCDEKITVREGQITRYSFESGRLSIYVHQLDTDEVDFIKSAL